MTPPLPPPVTWALMPLLTANIEVLVMSMTPVDVVATTPLLTRAPLAPICPPVINTAMPPAPILFRTNPLAAVVVLLIVPAPE